MSTSAFPDYNAAVFPAVPSQQMYFSDVTALVFPLKASMAALTHFCDNFINFEGEAEKPPVRFRPAMPAVLLMVLDYGSMAIEWRNLGWFSQREVAFSILVEHFQKEKDKYVFQDWATIVPFIYVDDASSLRNGREVFGWPKVPVKLQSTPAAFEPTLPHQQLRFNIRMPSFGGQQRERDQTFLEVIHGGGQFGSTLSSLVDYLTVLPRMAANSLSTGRDFVTSLMDLAYARYSDAYDMKHVGSVASRGWALWQSLMPWNYGTVSRSEKKLPSYLSSSITLKQFRDARDSSAACYQAIVSAQMNVDRVSDFGPLFNILSGDYSGGYSIRLTDINTQPIVRQLGIDVDSSAEGINILRPVFPVWMKVDLSYGGAHTICWRSGSSQWINGPGNPGVDLRDAPELAALKHATARAVRQLKDPKQAATALCGDALRAMPSFAMPVQEVFNKIGTAVAERSREMEKGYPDSLGAIRAARHAFLSALQGIVEGRFQGRPNQQEQAVLEKLLDSRIAAVDPSEYSAILTKQLKACAEASAEAFDRAIKDQSKRPTIDGAISVAPQLPPYITLGSGALFEVAGSFQFDSVTARVLPLKAEAGKLLDFCNRYLNHGFDRRRDADKKADGIPPFFFEPWGSWVALLTISFAAPTELTAGTWLLPADREMALVMPVKCFNREKRIVGFGLAPLLSFIDSQTSVISEREVYGRPALQAIFHSPSNEWIEPIHPSRKDKRLLTVSTETLTALNQGQQAKYYHVVDIVADHDWEDGQDAGREDTIPQENGQLLSGLNPFFNVALKQIVLAEDSTKACYQSVVLTDWRVEYKNCALLTSAGMKPLCVAAASLPDSIFPELGLHGTVSKSDPKDPLVKLYLQAVSPFWVHVSLSRSEGRNLYYRAGAFRWNHDPSAAVDTRRPQASRPLLKGEDPKTTQPQLTELKSIDAIVEPIGALLAMIESELRGRTAAPRTSRRRLADTT